MHSTILHIPPKSDPEGGSDILKDRIKTSLQRALHLGDEDFGEFFDMEDEEDSFEDQLKEALASKTCFVILPGPIEKDTLQELKDEFQGVGFFILYSKLNPGSDLCSCEALHFLDPPLLEQDEKTIMKNCFKAKKDLIQKYSQRQQPIGG